MSCSVKRLFKINKDVLEVLLMLDLSRNVLRFDLFCSAASWSEACLFFCNDCFCLVLQPALFNSAFSMALLGWPIRLIVR